ncbi:hypothetical protein L0N33_23690, partial [Roseburia faecis]|nr:hypothetical protein [Roseburia faecis]
LGWQPVPHAFADHAVYNAQALQGVEKSLRVADAGHRVQCLARRKMLKASSLAAAQVDQCRRGQGEGKAIITVAEGAVV